MNIIPRNNRNTRYSMQESVNRKLGLDRLRDPQKMPGFQELLAQEGVEQLLKSIIDARFDKMDITKELLAQMESDDSPFDYGYLYEPESNRWLTGTKKDAEERKLPWFKTSREAIDALYDNGFRDVHGDQIFKFDIEDLYGKMNELLGSEMDARMTNAQASRTDPNVESEAEKELMDKMLRAGMYSDTGKYGPDGKPIRELRKYEPHGVPYRVASTLLPFRTLGMMNDPELENNPKTVPFLEDAAEAILTGWNPFGKLAKAGMLGGAKTLSKIPVLGKMFGDAAKNFAFHPFTRATVENVVGNMGTEAAMKGADFLADPENEYQSAPLTKEGLAVAGLGGAAIPLLSGGLFLGSKLHRAASGYRGDDRIPLQSLATPEEQIRLRMKNTYNTFGKNPSSAGVRALDVPDKYVREMADANSYSDFVNKPFKELENKGYTHYGVKRVPKIDMQDKADKLVAFKAQLKDALGSPAGFDEWANKNEGELVKLMDDPTLLAGTMTGDTKFMTHEDYAGRQSKDHSQYLADFAYPTSGVEAEHGLGIDDPKTLHNRYSMKKRANADAENRYKYVNVPKDKMNAKPSADRSEGGMIDNRGKALELLMTLTRDAGLHMDSMIGTDPYKYEAIPTKGGNK